MTSGIVNVLKPPGLTSHDAVARIRRIYGEKKVGHAGTLDPDAAGVLPVFIGKATRLLEYASVGTKGYRGTGILGVRTDTGDDSGNVLERMPANITEEQMNQALQQFRGKISQVPPMYSALKIQGKKLYEYARQGLVLERAARTVEIISLSQVYFRNPYFCIDVECSKGTYIRTLLEDIAASVGTCACMLFLLRTKAGDFTIEDSFTLEEIEKDPAAALLPPETAVTRLPVITVNELQAYRITNGVKTTVQGTAPGQYRLNYGNIFLGVVSVENEIIKPEKILAQINGNVDQLKH